MRQSEVKFQESASKVTSLASSDDPLSETKMNPGFIDRALFHVAFVAEHKLRRQGIFSPPGTLLVNCF